MALDQKTSIAARNRSLDAAYDVLNNGFLDIYDGAKPTDANTALGAQVKLVRLTLAATACAPAANGSKATNAIGSALPLAAGVPTWATFVQSDGTRVCDVTVGQATANLILAAASIVLGATVTCSGYTFTQAA